MSVMTSCERAIEARSSEQKKPIFNCWQQWQLDIHFETNVDGHIVKVESKQGHGKQYHWKFGFKGFKTCFTLSKVLMHLSKWYVTDLRIKIFFFDKTEHWTTIVPLGLCFDNKKCLKLYILDFTIFSISYHFIKQYNSFTLFCTLNWEWSWWCWSIRKWALHETLCDADTETKPQGAATCWLNIAIPQKHIWL